MSNENWHIELFQITLMYNNAVRECIEIVVCAKRGTVSRYQKAIGDIEC